MHDLLTCMRKQHAQSNTPLLGHQFAILPDLHRFQLLIAQPSSVKDAHSAHNFTCTRRQQKASSYRRQFLDQLRIVQRQFPLLDELHARNARDHLGAAGDPEDRVHGHGLILAHAHCARRMFEDGFALFIDRGKDHAWSTSRVRSECVDLGLELGDSFRCYGGHVFFFWFESTKIQGYKINGGAHLLRRRLSQDKYLSSVTTYSTVPGVLERVLL